MKKKEFFQSAKEIFADFCKVVFFPRASVKEIEGTSMEEFAKECTAREAAVFYANRRDEGRQGYKTTKPTKLIMFLLF